MEKVNFMFIVLLGIFVVLFLNNVSSLDFTVEKIDRGSVIVSELGNRALYEFIINNTGAADVFEIYSLVGLSFEPEWIHNLPEGVSRLELYVKANEDIVKKPGLFSFEYEVKGRNSGIFRDRIFLKIVPLEELFEISAEPLNPSESSANVIVKNKESVRVENVTIKFDSEFFSATKELSFGPKQEIKIPVEVNKARAEKIVAGAYIIKAEIEVNDKEAEIEGVMQYLEKTGTSIETEKSGFILRKTRVTKTNQGNVPTTAQVEIKKDIISRLFTINSPEPVSSERNGLFVSYLWEKDIAPKESLSVTSTTSYTVPLIILILAVLVGLMAKIYSQTALTLTKTVSFVKTRGGEFALKVNLHVKSKKHVDKIQVFDSLPAMTKIYEKFGKMPDKVDHATRRLIWNIERLSSGEERVYSYVIYSSELRVVGRFELPVATAVFEKDGKTQEVWSNRAFFASETVKGK
ncbi:hypothetical protein HYV50_01630 [Candidatus Pacearchaeota archaeon]|nr:hypothetical protein [Candidatus Pacearchaeota archaeon]